MTLLRKADDLDRPVPNVDHLITEDDTPVDNPFSDKQQDLLMGGLFDSGWKPASEKFVAFANVGLFAKDEETTLVPDALLSLDVSQPSDLWKKGHRGYFTWLYGKPPDVVIEVVSGKAGGEDERKLRDYAVIRVAYYSIFDPQKRLSREILRVYELVGGHYQKKKPMTRLNKQPLFWLEDAHLGLTLWQGTYHDTSAIWLRWCDASGSVLPTGAEMVVSERERSERLAERLRMLGVNPDEL
jgi:Uma2 family endonuclease